MDLNTFPTCQQIDRACRIYTGGGDYLAIAEALCGELTVEGLFLVYHAAKTAHVIDERFPYPSTRL